VQPCGDYSVDYRGSLQSQVVLLLTELEDGGKGVPPTEDEVNFVLRKVGHMDGKLSK
jgi:hypothetical protein